MDLETTAVLSFLARRLLLSLPVLAIVISATFLLIRIAPGSPFLREKNIDPAVLARLEERFQLNGPLHEQLAAYWGNLLRGDFGDSTQFRNRTVAEIISQTLPNSMLVGGLGFLLALAIGISAGSFAALHQNKAPDRLAMLAALAGICLPTFVIAIFFILGLAILLPIFPVAGWGAPAHLVLPVICLALPYGAYTARLMRTSMLEVLHQDFIRTARAKGLHDRIVVCRHALKIALLPIVSYAGPLAANVLTGSVVIEELFLIPGMGPFFINSILNKDVFLAAGAVIVYSTLLILMNLLVDVLYTLLDPRVRIA